MAYKVHLCHFEQLSPVSYLDGRLDKNIPEELDEDGRHPGPGLLVTKTTDNTSQSDHCCQIAKLFCYFAQKLRKKDFFAEKC